MTNLNPVRFSRPENVSLIIITHLQKTLDLGQQMRDIFILADRRL
jgi:hypothetical protein